MYEPGDVGFMSDELGIHLMENPSDSEGTVSLHVYIPPFDSCKTFGKEGGETGICPMTFHSVNGQVVAKQEDTKEEKKTRGKCTLT